MQTPKDILKQHWGFEDFRPMQEDIVNACVAGDPVLALLPTGGGKSICFQVPALLKDGLCIVISPLIALMKDQVEQLTKRGIKAVAIYSGMNKREIDYALDNCVNDSQIKFLYVSPERIKTELFLARAEKMNISMLAIDEAHCISQWGYDFRPSYLEISDFIEALQIKSIIALTASATREVKKDILAKLGIDNAKVFQKSFARPNLSYSVFNLENKEQKLLEILQKVPGSGVVYVRSRKQTQDLAEYLRSQGISAANYHAGLNANLRASRQDDWLSGKIRIMIATNAFGMGIDKPDVRTVIHFDLPDSLEAYYQEAGRAGRDEKKAFAVQLYSNSDLENLTKRAEQSVVSAEFLKKVYQSLANHYKLAVGSEAFLDFPFDQLTFCRKFELPMIDTFHALNQLSEEGLVQLSESFKETSKIHFVLEQSEVYKFQVANSKMDPVIKVLMRLYGGELFTDFIAIKEKDIAALLKESVDKVINQLTYLDQADVIIYHKAQDQPKITFLTPRQDANNLPLDHEQINWRREVAINKAKAMAQYVTTKVQCRSRMIQRYFDETDAQECGKCDKCIERKKHQATLPLTEVESYVLTEERSEKDLITNFSNLSESVLAESLRILMDQKRIQFTFTETYKRP
ncbi:MAG: RecQ family ATP-dependent DNA helicase [Cyclobacteriaceae bacterium]